MLLRTAVLQCPRGLFQTMIDTRLLGHPLQGFHEARIDKTQGPEGGMENPVPAPNSAECKEKKQQKRCFRRFGREAGK